MSRLGVYSETGRLRKVMVHRPDLALRRLTPKNHEQLLFDELLWVDRAVREHDAFVKVLKGEGVRVYYLQELLQDALSSGKARRVVVERVIHAMTVGRRQQSPSSGSACLTWIPQRLRAISLAA